MNYIDSEEYKINDYINKFSFKYNNLPNITGVGVGRKNYEGFRTNIPTVTFFVEKKFSVADIPPKYILPQNIGSMMTDVIETGKIASDFEYKYTNYSNTGNKIYPDISLDKIRPAYGGLSCSNKLAPPACEGCIGYAVTDIAEEKYIYLLSCNHVLTKDFLGRVGDEIVQPAQVYRNSAFIGKLGRAISLKVKSDKTDDPMKEINDVNAAIAFIGPNNSDIRKSLLQPGIGPDRIIIDEIKEPKIGDEVWKIGPYPQLTKTIGQVENVNVTLFGVKINDKVFEFRGQNFAGIKYNKGDSGAIIMRDSNSVLFKKRYALGMCIGGAVPSSGKPYALFTNMNQVLEALKVKFLK